MHISCKVTKFFGLLDPLTDQREYFTRAKSGERTFMETNSFFLPSDFVPTSIQDGWLQTSWFSILVIYKIGFSVLHLRYPVLVSVAVSFFSILKIRNIDYSLA